MPQNEGDVIGDRYRLVRKIGEGGMASVWEAEHVSLGNLIAVKFLHRTAPKGSEVAERFLREARVAAQVKHRNTVEIMDFGFTLDDVPYMVMERMRGQPLADHMLLHGQLEFDEAARLVSLTLRGLAAVHDAGIVHRDLKPDNIFLVHDEDGLFPKLLDFGLSRPAGKSKMTQEGTLMGTPDYMSPEQARGLTDLDARTDIYSMGVILYEMITGMMPFNSEHVGDLLAMIARDEPTPLTQYRADAPPELVAVIDRAMSKNRELRFPDAREMRNALVDLWGGFADAGSGLTSLSEMPPPPDGSSGLLGRVSRTPSGGQRRPTGSGMSLNPTFPRRVTGSGVGPNPVIARPSVGGRANAQTLDEPAAQAGGIERAERRSLEEAHTVAAMPALSPSPAATPAPAPDDAHGPQSLRTTLFAVMLVAAASATLAFVWIARGGGEDAATATFGEVPGFGALMAESDAGATFDSGVDAGGQDGGMGASIDGGGAAIEAEDPPTKRTKRRTVRRRTTTKRRGGRVR